VPTEERSEEVRAWLEATTKLMVDQPEKVEVKEGISPDGSTSYFSIHVDYSDLGKVVGREGSNITAIRKLTSAMCQAQYGRRSDVTAYDPSKDPKKARRAG
jgi:predicted RNA-binding protein YlqC (UPF0109 family)